MDARLGFSMQIFHLVDKSSNDIFDVFKCIFVSVCNWCFSRRTYAHRKCGICCVEYFGTEVKQRTP